MHRERWSRTRATTHGQSSSTTNTNDSINKTLRTLALILDEAEDAGWVTRNVARGRRTREPVERRKREVLEADELVTLLDAADQLDSEQHKPETLTRGREVRRLRDEAGMTWKEIAGRIGAAASTAIYLYGCEPNERSLSGPRRGIVATLALAGLRVSELCALDNQDIQLVVLW
jgi:integrase